MTVSATATWNRTRDQLIQTSLRLIAELGTGEAPSTDQIACGADFLQSLLLELHVRGVTLHCREEVSVSLTGVSTTTPYVTAATDTENIERLGAFVRSSSDIDIALTMWDVNQYAGIAYKTIEGVPGYFTPHVQSDHSIRIYLYPVPIPADYPTLTYWRSRRFKDTDRGNYNVDVPVKFQEALECGLAWKFAKHYGRDAQADKNKEEWRSLINAALNNEAPRGSLSFVAEPLFGG